MLLQRRALACGPHTRGAAAPALPSTRSGASGAPSRRGCVQQRRALELLATPQVVMDAAAVTNATYATLGLTAASFVGTFVVAPRFKSSFKEDIDWKVMYQALKQTGVPSVTPADAHRKRGSAALVDVRLPSKYQDLRASGSVSLPLYIPIQQWDLASIIRRVGFAFFGIFGTELNTNFVEDVARAVPKGRQIILICENGGSLQNKSGTLFGFQSRSLKAAFYLQRAGYKVSYVQGGLAQWASEGLPLSQGAEEEEEEDDDSDDGGELAGTTAAAGRGLQQLLAGVFSG